MAIIRGERRLCNCAFTIPATDSGSRAARGGMNSDYESSGEYGGEDRGGGIGNKRRKKSRARASQIKHRPFVDNEDTEESVRTDDTTTATTTTTDDDDDAAMSKRGGGGGDKKARRRRQQTAAVRKRAVSLRGKIGKKKIHRRKSI